MSEGETCSLENKHQHDSIGHSLEQCPQDVTTSH